MSEAAVVVDAPVDAPEAAPVASPDLKVVADAPAATPATPVVDAPAPDDAGSDWRKQVAGDDEKRLKALERYPDLASYDKAFRDTQTALRDSGRIKVPGKDATPEEIAEFGKTLGVPETPDDYEITVKPPEGLEIGEADQAVLKGAVAKLHAKGGFAATPEVANLAHEVYYEMMEEQASQMAAAAEVAKQSTERNLKTDWGSEFKINMGYANSAIQSYFNADSAEDVLNWVGADGTRLGDNEAFVRAMTAAGRATSEDPAFLQTLTGGDMSGDALDTEISKIKAWRTSSDKADQKRYAEASQPGGKLQQLLARKERVSSR